MIEQTDAFNEHAHGAELANQDEADAMREQDDSPGMVAIVGPAMALGLGTMIAAVFWAWHQGWL